MLISESKNDFDEFSSNGSHSLNSGSDISDERKGLRTEADVLTPNQQIQVKPTQYTNTVSSSENSF